MAARLSYFYSKQKLEFYPQSFYKWPIVEIRRQYPQRWIAILPDLTYSYPKKFHTRLESMFRISTKRKSGINFFCTFYWVCLKCQNYLLENNLMQDLLDLEQSGCKWFVFVRILNTMVIGAKKRRWNCNKKLECYFSYEATWIFFAPEILLIHYLWAPFPSWIANDINHEIITKSTIEISC